MLTLIVEGCDRLGKSTLVDGLDKLLNANFDIAPGEVRHVHSTYPPKGLTREEQIAYQKQSYDAEINLINTTNTINIFDRFLLGEKIYGPKYRGYEPDYINQFEERLDIHQTFLVVLTADVELVQSRYDGDFIKYEDIKWLLDSYKTEFKLSRIIKKLELDVTRLSVEDVVTNIYNFIKSGVYRHFSSAFEAHATRYKRNMSAMYQEPIACLFDSAKLNEQSQKLNELANWFKYDLDRAPVKVSVAAGTTVMMSKEGTTDFERVVLSGDFVGSLTFHDGVGLKTTICNNYQTIVVHGYNIKNITAIR